MSTDVNSLGIARGRLISHDGQTLVFEPAHSSYRLHLAAAGPIEADVGQRISGIIEGKALRLFVSQAGGTFIEPLWGAPRIANGRIGVVDHAGNRLLVSTAAPIWVHIGDSGQSATQFAIGQVVNFYLQSGTQFRQANGIADS